MRVWVAVTLTLTLFLLVYFFVPRRHVAAVIPADVMDMIVTPEIPFEWPGATELGGIFIDDILPRWKHGGGTMAYILNATFGGFVHPASSEGRAVGRLAAFRNTEPTAWPIYQTLYTHEDFSFPSLIPYPVATAVFIRDPADNRRSIYDSQGIFRRWCSGKYKNITDWIGTPDYPRNYQIEWVAGATNYWPWSKATARYVNHMVTHPEEMLQVAKENLAKTVFLGITERHNESICLFFYSMRLPPKTEGRHWKSVHLIRADKKSEVHRDLQTPLLKLEYEFYEFAVALFDARIEWMKRDFEANHAHTVDFVGPECEGVLF